MKGEILQSRAEFVLPKLTEVEVMADMMLIKKSVALAAPVPPQMINLLESLEKSRPLMLLPTFALKLVFSPKGAYPLSSLTFASVVPTAK